MKHAIFKKLSIQYFLAFFALLAINSIFRMFFIFYGYIATEEGSSIYSQQLAWQGLLPFVDYAGWNSLLNDYLIGWFQFFLPPTILMQRFVGFGISMITFFLTLEIASYFKNKVVILLTGIFLTFGSYTYLYLSTIPYSEQTMTLFLLLSLYFLSQNLKREKPRIFLSVMGSISIAFSLLIRIQIFPASLLIFGIFLYLHRHAVKNCFMILGLTALAIAGVCLPFLIKGPEQFFYSFTWPLYADKILLYQQNAGINLTSIIRFLQETFTDYGIFILLLIPGTLYLFQLWKEKQYTKQIAFVTLFLFISFSFIATGLLHKPPYATYIYPSVPLLSIAAAFVLWHITQKIPQSIRVFIYMLVGTSILGNFILFPHFRFIKTSLATINKTPHTYLLEIAQFVEANSNPSDTIVSFYTPLSITAHRTILPRLSRDRFSLSLLPESEAQKHHLMSEALFTSYISERKPKMIIFTNKTKQYFGRTEIDRQKILELLEQNYTLVKEFSEIRFIEDPKTSILSIYLRKNNQ